MPMTPLSTPPQTSDPSNFDARADTMLGVELPRLVTQINAVVAYLNGLSTSVTTSTTDAQAAATLAVSLQTSAIALANFKGNWSALTGALAIPASVLHNGALWLLNTSLANVTTATPGVSSSWTLIQYPGGMAPDQQPRNRELGSAATLDQTWIDFSVVFDPGSVASGAQTTNSVAVPGVVLGDFVQVSISIAAVGMQVTAYASATGFVTVLYQNSTGSPVDLASHTIYLRVMKRLQE
jgi:hypothetical protein